MEAERALLGLVDYIIFALMLLVSAGIGVFFRFSGGQQKTTDEYLLAGKDMSILPVAFSLMASFLSAITVIGVPAEMYRFGINLAYLNIGYVIGMVVTAYISLPVFFELNASTAYEYLDKRFGKLARTLTSVVFVFQMILYMSVVLYAPALALSAVTNLSTWVSVISIGVVCTFYCTLGGMKAVLWTDVFQALLMFLGIFAVLIKGFLDVGITDVYNIALEGGRLGFPGFEWDLTQRYTIWNIMIQGVVLSMISFGGNQVQIQRLLTVKNISRSRLSLYVSIPMGCSFHLLNCLVGIVIYAYYSTCDPMTREDNPISSADQLLPYYMMSTLSAYPGLPGLCICGVFSASLSTVSSAVNSLTAVTMQDLLKPFLVSRGLSQKKMAFSAKAITLFYGFLCIILTFLVASFGNLVQASLTVFGMLGGPVLSVFFLGMMTTRANEKGAVIGLLSAISIAAWISFGASANAPDPKFLPVSLEGCPANTSLTSSILNETMTLSLISRPEVSMLNESMISDTEAIAEEIFPVYKLSYMWFAPIGLIVGLVVGYVASIIINLISGETPDVPEELLSPLVKYFMNKKTNTKEKEMKAVGSIELKNVSKKATNGVTAKASKEKERF
ncbi:putative sodium-dependent multivitamin transporter [Trichonephila inaurata madagascariensis]|uniref:Putative sodium-dependent multivitamin transporter n=1 Tax=Trichonephila inaurata madagascariensis TaxID=2747483 RepID=A0A8X7BVZ1_9ARAC|nr:putative sodium-dependent multivitamin transporter [Trichonephila inaurata madagascariensis]